MWLLRFVYVFLETMLGKRSAEISAFARTQNVANWGEFIETMDGIAPEINVVMEGPQFSTFSRRKNMEDNFSLTLSN